MPPLLLSVKIFANGAHLFFGGGGGGGGGGLPHWIELKRSGGSECLRLSSDATEKGRSWSVSYYIGCTCSCR